MIGRSVLELSRVPPSLNRMATRGNRFAVSKAKKSMEEELVWELLAKSVPKPLMRVEASAELRFPTRHRRDPDNFGWLLSKALGDALAPHDRDAPHRWLPDDTAEFFTFHSPVTIVPERGSPLTRLELTWHPRYLR